MEFKADLLHSMLERNPARWVDAFLLSIAGGFGFVAI
jgi:hypothetical protein